MDNSVQVRGFPGPRFRTWGSQFSGRIREATGAALAIMAASVLFLSGCGHQQTAARLPAPQEAPPPVQQTQGQAQTYPTASEGKPQAGRIAPTPAPPGGISADDLDYVNTHKPIRTEEGLATWYTAARGRRCANGQVFSDRSLTAAHRTLPMGSLIVVTNLTTGQSAAMRITDRGPFVEDKLIDLTIASAKATGIYRVGSARVRLDVYRTPKPIDTGGRWCVQIGAFQSHHKAKKLKAQLERKYPDAKVIEFPGEDSYWVRIRPEGDNREQAEAIARRLRPAQGEAYLTRLD